VHVRSQTNCVTDIYREGLEVEAKASREANCVPTTNEALALPANPRSRGSKGSAALR